MDPAAMSMQMSPIPGAPVGPGNMNGNPMNVNDFGTQQASMDPQGYQDNHRASACPSSPWSPGEEYRPLASAKTMAPRAET